MIGDMLLPSHDVPHVSLHALAGMVGFPGYPFACFLIHIHVRDIGMMVIIYMMYACMMSSSNLVIHEWLA